MDTTILYSLDKNNKVKQWAISVIDNKNQATIVVTHGYKDGKMTETYVNISEGKNIGKKNETTYLQQAVKDAQSRIEKKIKEGYTYEQKDSNDSGIILPMLAQEYKKHKSKIIFPCFVQPKLDGYRMIYDPVTDKMTTRTGKEFTILQNSTIHHQLRKLKLNFPVDGELYVHNDLKFEQYGVLRKKTITDKDIETINKIQYHIYDIITDDEFEERNNILNNLTLQNKLQAVNTVLCKDDKELEKNHENNIKQGYEGSMIRNKKGKYSCKYRSYDLLKYKNFDDGEYEIVGFTHENDTTGNNEHLIVWICQTSTGVEFNVQSKGLRKERQDLYKEASKYIGKRLWVQYFGLTNDGVPRFPKTMREGKDSIREEII
jgi:ATP-dependent DNA ligase